jgi:hypothetical protein
VVQEAISRSNDESTLQKLREMQERLQADIRPEQKSGQ